MGKLGSFFNDMQVLCSMWFGSKKGKDHKERLDSFYTPQAKNYDAFRARMLHGKSHMLKMISEQFKDKKNIVWVDLGGGTGENVTMMSQYIPLSHFKSIYVVDLCTPLCDVAEAKVQSNEEWRDVVHVVNEDACLYQPPEQAELVTFSYALTMIPPFHAAVDNAQKMMTKDGLLGVCDFYVSDKHDSADRQHWWYRRFFWRALFDIDGVFVGPERRAYLEHKFQRIKEFNSAGRFPYVPFLKAPYYAWIGEYKLA